MKLVEDKTLVEKWNQFILKGDLNALSKVFLYYYDFLFDYGMRNTDDKQYVEDAIQDIFLNLIKSRKNIGLVRNLTGYLTSTFRRQLFVYLNKKKKIILSEQLPEEQFEYFKSPGQEIPEHKKKEQLYLIIEHCVEKLTTRQQEVLFLRFKKEISYEEISEMLNISVDSCYKLVYRTVKMIRLEAEKLLYKGENMIFWFYTFMRK